MTSIHSLTKDEIAELCNGCGFPSYRASQIWHWLYVQKVSDWGAMKNVPMSVSQELAKHVSIDSCVPTESAGEEGSTRKLLVKLCDGECIEQVLISSYNRWTVCVSSQVGCKFKCSFCASGQAGFRRNLEAGEMVGQVLLAEQICGKPVSNVVFMGIGEPLDNYDQVIKAIRILNDPDGLCIGARRITISTCGIVPGIRRFANENLQVELSVSLHATDDKLRSRLMPVNKRYPLRNLIEACQSYVEQTNRIITFEYVLINNVNDSRAQAEALVGILASLRCRVNLISLSTVPEYQGKPTSRQTAEMFIGILKKARINATIRTSKGGSMRAACGQLRHATLKR